MHNDNNYDLYHYGVLGMKWGVRKDGSKNKGSSNKKPSRIKKKVKTKVKTLKKRIKGDYPKSQDFAEAAKIRQRPVSSMSNQELTKVIKRLELEERYSDLTSKKTNRGKKKVDEMLKYADTANKLASTYSTLKKLKVV